MGLSDFIAPNREPILAEWEAFARKAKPASDSMDIASLRAHANEMLTTIAADLKPNRTSMNSFLATPSFKRLKGHGINADTRVGTGVFSR